MAESLLYKTVGICTLSLLPALLIEQAYATSVHRAGSSLYSAEKFTLFLNFIHSFIHSFRWHLRNVTIPCHSQELLPILSAMYFFLSPFSTNYSSILSHLISPSVSWSTSQSSCPQIHIQYPFGNSIFSHSLYMPKPM